MGCGRYGEFLLYLLPEPLRLYDLGMGKPGVYPALYLIYAGNCELKLDIAVFKDCPFFRCVPFVLS